MSDFEYLFALFGLLFGLIVAELSLKFADAIECREERPVGVLTPTLALLILTDLTNFWLFLWGSRHVVTVSFRTVFCGVILAMIYFLSASLTFPRRAVGCVHLDDHYWRRKRIVVGGIFFVNVVVNAALVARSLPAWNDWWFYFYFPSYLIALGVLALSRSRRLDLFCLGWALLVNLGAGSDLMPHSQFGIATGIVPTNGS